MAAKLKPNVAKRLLPSTAAGRVLPGDKPKMKPPAPMLDTARKTRVETPPTTGARLTSAGDEVNADKTRASFREEEFTKLIRQHGKFVIWRKALLCPCQSPETNQPALACPRCNGGGYLYIDPHQIQALMSMFDKRTSIYEKFGLWQEGQVQISVEAPYRLGYRDSLEMIHSVIPMNELLKKGDRRGMRHKLPKGVDTARFRIVNVSSILAACGPGGIGKLLTLEPEIHFTITDEGWIRWTARGEALVPDQTLLSIHYDFHPIYVVQSWMHVTRDDLSAFKTGVGVVHRAISLPVQAMGKMLWLVDSNALPSFDAPVAKPTGMAGALP